MELKKGDIIIFKGEEHWLSKAICWLTDSDVCHAAMVYSDESIVECVAPGVCVNPVFFKSGDEFHILRKSPEIDPTPLLMAADSYRDAKICYDFSGLILFGGLLLFKKFKPLPFLIPIINQSLIACCKKLNEYIHHALLHNESGMVCSQFVYQLYEDCGDAYRIQLQHATIQNSLADHTSASLFSESSDQIFCLADHLDFSDVNTYNLGSLNQNNLELDDLNLDELELELLVNNSLPFHSADPDFLSNITYDIHSPELESLCRNFLSVVNEESDELLASDGNSVSFELPANTRKLAEAFLIRIRKLLALTGGAQTLDSMFVTPADLAYHAVNLETVGYGALDRK